MERWIWDAYDHFHCIAQSCPDSCCKEWEVDVDDASAADYRTLPGAVGDTLRKHLRQGEFGAYLELTDGRCPMWRGDGLCQLQLTHGHDKLCQVCREYPRLYMDYGDFAEWGLELSCPEAARLILSGLNIRAEDVPGEGVAEYDREVMCLLKTSRQALLHFWHTSDHAIPEKLAVTLLFAHQVQGAIDGAPYEPLDGDACLQSARACTGKGDIFKLISFYQGLEILTQEWPTQLAAPQWGAWAPEIGALAVYLICRYWLQSVWDMDLVCRAKLILSACLTVNALGGDSVRTAQLFSKEIENDPDNREAILDGAYCSEAFTDQNLLSLLLK